MDWDFDKCGSVITNPYCLNARPTDPYSWHYEPRTKRWVQHLEASTTVSTYKTGSFVSVDGSIMVCGAPNGCIGGGYNGYSGENSWATREAYYAAAGASGPNLPVPGPTMTCDSNTSAPKPDKRTKACEKRPNDGPASNCVNPCIRLGANYNGPLAVNSDPGQCRVFPNTTAGGNSTDPNRSCQTVCPEACVELWDTCPPGTGPLVSLMQTKTASDVIALSGPYRADGAVNPLWADGIYVAPLIYSINTNGTSNIQQPIGGKPYTECYRYNTEYCDLPIARQEQVFIRDALGNVTSTQIGCFAGCPNGTYPSQTEQYQCLFFTADKQPQPPASTYGSGPSEGPPPELQQVFCNPQYYDPIYAPDPYKGIQIGCKARPLATKQGSTCGPGTTAVVNDNFNLEWCMPECPTGYTTDLTGSTCMATCDGSMQGAVENRGTLGSYTLYGFNPFLDYVDFYSTQFKCKAGVNCTQDFTTGRCPSARYTPQKMNDQRYGAQEVLNGLKPEDVLVHWSSLNTEGPARMAKMYTETKGARGLSPQQYAAWRSHYEAVKAYQTANPHGPNAKSRWHALKELGADSTWIRCPFGMVQGDESAMLENGNLCYDKCPDGYKADSYCANGAKDCPTAQRVHVCRAECPKQEEGLGPWVPINDPPLYACKYKYPKGESPKDPNLWVKCPDDGRFTVQTASSSDIATESSALARAEPMCVRNTFLRYITCPVGFNEYTDPTTGVTNCVQACNAESMVFQLEDTKTGAMDWYCQSGGVQDGRYTVDVPAAADTGALPEFSNRVLRRLNFPKGTGIDPTTGLSSSSGTGSSGGSNNSGLLIGLGGGGVFFILAAVVLFFLLRRKK